MEDFSSTIEGVLDRMEHSLITFDWAWGLRGRLVKIYSEFIDNRHGRFSRYSL